MTQRGRSRTRVGGEGRQSAALLALLTVAALAVAGCPDENECERCDLIFRWDSNGNFVEMTETCAALDCGVARCGSCYDLEYNTEGLPQRGTCDTCSSEDASCQTSGSHPAGEPGAVWMYCVNARTDDYPYNCVDIYSNPLHCGECDIACLHGQVCSDGQCICPGAANAFCVSAGADWCVDLETDADHCGECDNPCAAEQTCVDGRCV